MFGAVADAAVDIRVVERVEAERRAYVVDRIREVASGRRERAVEVEHQQVYWFLHPRSAGCQDSGRPVGCQTAISFARAPGSASIGSGQEGGFSGNSPS